MMAKGYFNHDSGELDSGYCYMLSTDPVIKVSTLLFLSFISVLEIIEQSPEKKREAMLFFYFDLNVIS